MAQASLSLTSIPRTPLACLWDRILTHTNSEPGPFLGGKSHGRYVDRVETPFLHANRAFKASIQRPVAAFLRSTPRKPDEHPFILDLVDRLC